MPRKGGVPENLRPKFWVKGQSGNPAGRPPTKAIEEIFQEFLNEHVTPKSGGAVKQRLQAMIEAQWLQAVKGNTPAANFIADRAYGRAKQTIDLKGSLDIQENRKGVVERLLERAKK